MSRRRGRSARHERQVFGDDTTLSWMKLVNEDVDLMWFELASDMEGEVLLELNTRLNTVFDVSTKASEVNQLNQWTYVKVRQEGSRAKGQEGQKNVKRPW